jgi:hypothetical protein
MLRQGLAGGGAEAGDRQEKDPRAGQPGRLQARRADARVRLRRNWMFAVVFGLAVVPRVIVMLGFQPAILFKLDTYDYLWDAVHRIPNLANPGGYSLFLMLLEPFRSLLLVSGLQHLLGLSVAVMMYAVLRRYGVRRWLATLATLPLLFSPSEFLLEQLVMADFMALFLLMAAFAVLLLRPEPSVWRTVTAGLLMGASAVVRPTALPLIALMAGFLLVRRAGWLRVGAVLAAGALPVVMYMAWFNSFHGSFNITNSNGLFLWSRTMSFADCNIIKPPADLAALCPNRQKGVGIVQAPPFQRQQPKYYLWNHQGWMWQEPPPNLVPDTAAFTAANNARAMRFAILAIKRQPLDYAKTVGLDVLHPFFKPNLFVFPAVSQSTAKGLGPRNAAYALAALKAYTGSDAGVGKTLGRHFGETIVQPWAHLVRGYQRFIHLPGPVFGLILVIGFVGILIPRRRLAASGLLLSSAVVTVLLPIVEHEYNYRYVIAAVPLACMAAAMALRDRSGEAATASALTGSALTGSALNRTAPTGTAPTGTAPNGSAPTATAPTGTAPNGSAPTGTAPSGPDLAKPEPAKPEPATPEPATPEPAKPEPAKPELAEP